MNKRYRYRPVKIVMTAYIAVFVDDTMSVEEQEKKMQDWAIDFVQCLDNSDVEFDYAEFND